MLPRQPNRPTEKPPSVDLARESSTAGDVVNATDAVSVRSGDTNVRQSSALTEDVHACDVEMVRGLQHVAVVRVYLLEAMLLGAGQVERVAGSNEDRARKIPPTESLSLS